MSNQIKVELQDSMGSDRSIAEAAWTSSFDNQKKKLKTQEDVERVVNMLADLKHSTPFESVIFRFWIKLPISADRQFMTHRLQSASGLSGRYRTMPSEFLTMPDDVHDISTRVMQEAPELDLLTTYEDLCLKANNLYKQALANAKKAEQLNTITNEEYKRFREFFRGILPQNNMTERVSIMNLRAWSNFIKLRNSPHAQPEIRQIAQLMLKEVENHKVCPIALEALKRNNWVI